MADRQVLTRVAGTAHPKVITEGTDSAILDSIIRSTSGAASLWTDANTTSIIIGSSNANTTIGGDLRGNDDGTGLILGHAGSGASTGSAPQTVSLTTTEKDDLVEADGMFVYDETLGKFQGRVSSEWVDLGAGDVTGIISRLATLPQAITGVTEPSEITLGTGTTAQSFPDSSTTGQRFEVKVPEEYDSGDLTVNIVYSMSSAVASPNNVVRLEIAAEIADVSGGSFDTATYAAANFDITVPDNSTNVSRILTITISEGDFGSGDSIVILFKRLGGDGADLHTGALQVIGYDYAYLGQLASRDVMQVVSLFDDTDETANAPRTIDGTQGSFDTLEYLTAIDDEQKFEVAVPDNWDGTSSMLISIVSKMSTGASGVVSLELVAEIADVSGGSLVVDGPRTYLLTPPATTDLFRSASVFEIPASLLGVGDVITVKLARRGSTDANDTHGGTFIVLSAIATTASIPKIGFSAVTVESHYLEEGQLKIVSGSPTGTQEDPSFSGDFETWVLMTGTGSGDRIDVQYQGRLMSSQTQITKIEIPVKGTGEYQIKVFTEDNGATNQYAASALTAAPGTRTLITILAAGLTNQPSLSGLDEGRFHVVVEATLDNAEVLRVGRPYITQE